nr:hypothetical protein [Tanacetum cinerariifolium]
MLLCKQEEAGIQLNAEQADWRDDTDDESEDQELKGHYMYMAKLQEVSPDAADSGPIFDDEPLQKGESINAQDLETNLYWEFGKFTSQDGESLESYYSRFYKMMNELIRNQCDVTNH